MKQYSLKLEKNKNELDIIVAVVPQSHTERGFASLVVLNTSRQEEMINNLLLENNINKSNYILETPGIKLANDHAPYETKWHFIKKELDKAPRNKVKSKKEVKNISLKATLNSITGE
jgi:hypothetical protein